MYAAAAAADTHPLSRAAAAAAVAYELHLWVRYPHTYYAEEVAKAVLYSTTNHAQKKKNSWTLKSCHYYQSAHGFFTAIDGAVCYFIRLLQKTEKIHPREREKKRGRGRGEMIFFFSRWKDFCVVVLLLNTCCTSLIKIAYPLSTCDMYK